MWPANWTTRTRVTESFEHEPSDMNSENSRLAVRRNGRCALRPGLRYAAALCLGMLLTIAGCPFAPAGRTCSTDADCPVGDLSRCLVEGDGTGTCVACLTSADCDNLLFCDGAEVCTGNICEIGVDPCGDDVCLEDVDGCFARCLEEACDDGLFCNGEEFCDADGLCRDGEIPCADDEVCLEDSGCVECVTDDDCGQGETCEDNECERTSPSFSVTIEGCDEEECRDTNERMLTAVLSGNVSDGDFGFEWTVSDGASLTGDDDDTPESVVVTGRSGTIVVELAVRKLSPSSEGESVTDSCSYFAFHAETQPQVNAGTDMSHHVELAVGESVTFSQVDIPLLSAVGFDPCDRSGEFSTYEWTAVSTPDSVNQLLSTVQVLHPVEPGDGETTVDVQIDPPVAASSVTILKRDGTTGTVSNIVFPGPYVFMVSLTTSDGLTAADTVQRIITTPWLPQASEAGDFAALAVSDGVYNKVIESNVATNISMRSLSRVTGTIDFAAVDIHDETNASDLASISVTPGDAVIAIAPPFPAMNSGTYRIDAGLNAGQVSVASGDTGVRLLLGDDLSSDTAGQTRNIAAAAELGVPRTGTNLRYAGLSGDAVGTAGETAEALRGQGILFAEIKNDGRQYPIVWGADDAGGNFDDQDVRIYKPLNSLKGNANTMGFDVANFELLERVDTGATVADVAVGFLRNGTVPELVVAQAGVSGPVIRVYPNNGDSGENDKVYTVLPGQGAPSTPATVTLNYSGAGSTAPVIELASFGSATGTDLIVGDPFYDANNDGFAEGRVTILEGGAAGAIPAAGLAINVGAAYENLPPNTFGSYSGVQASDANDTEFFGFALAASVATGASRADVYVGAPGPNTGSGALTGRVYRIPPLALTGADVPASSLAVWSGESVEDQFGFTLNATTDGLICVFAPIDTTAAGKIYLFDRDTPATTPAANIPSVVGEADFNLFGLRMGSGVFEGRAVLIAASPGGGYVKIIRTESPLSNPAFVTTRLQLAAVDESAALVVGDGNGDGKNDLLVSRSDADAVTAVWGRR